MTEFELLSWSAIFGAAIAMVGARVGGLVLWKGGVVATAILAGQFSPVLFAGEFRPYIGLAVGVIFVSIAVSALKLNLTAPFAMVLTYFVASPIAFFVLVFIYV